MFIAKIAVLSLSLGALLPISQAKDVDCNCDRSLQAAGTSVATKQKVLIVGIGGWKSCLGQSANDQYISNRFLALVKRIRSCRPDLDVSYVMFCSPGLKTVKFDGQVQYYGRFGAGMVAEQNIGDCIARHKETTDSKVFVMGHSHGGWMAMRAAIRLGAIDGLFTMEPVSAAQCDTKDYLKNRTRKIFKRRQKIVPGCRRAPNDVNWNSVLAASGGNWTNFFLAPNTQKGDVYSSPISLANNVMIWAPAQGKYNAHHNLGMSTQTWSIIENGILNSLTAQTVLGPVVPMGSTISPVVPVPAPVQLEPIEKTDVTELPFESGAGAEQESSILVDPQANAPGKSNHPSPTKLATASRVSPELRTWWNADHSIARQGFFVTYQAESVFVQLKNGTTKRAVFSDLSQADQSWIRSQAAIGVVR
ncbi:MAG: hypothetical protein AB8B50_09935 [Pirellulaceae bacterium]